MVRCLAPCPDWPDCVQFGAPGSLAALFPFFDYLKRCGTVPNCCWAFLENSAPLAQLDSYQIVSVPLSFSFYMAVARMARLIVIFSTFRL